MNRKQYLAAGLFAIALCGVGVYVAAVWLFPKPTINVVFITLDTTRADHIGCYHHKAAVTPAIDRLATEGVLFEKAYSPAPLTLPTHATLFTGLYPAEHGLRTNGRGRLDSSIPTLPEIAASAGYDTAAFVASFVLDSKFGLDRGFTVYDDDLSTAEAADEAIHRQRDGRLVVDSALAWLKTPRQTPFFCWVHLYEPHFPYLQHEADLHRSFENPYDAEIAYTDLQVSRLLDYLKSSGLDEKTLVVVVGDHGEGLGEHVERTHGYTLYNSTQHVPLIVRLKGKTVPGYRASEAVPLVDMTPTLVELLGIRALSNMTGQSLMPALSGQQLTPRYCLAATDDPFLQNGWSPLQSVTAGDWKYIRTTTPELYHLAKDPGEKQNLASTAANDLSRMEQLLERLQRTLVPRQTSSVQLTAQERRALEGLGYIGGSQQQANTSAGGSLPDIKEMLPYDYAAQDALELLHAGHTDEAIKILRDIVAKSSAHLAAKVFLGEALEHSGNRKEAAALYRSVLKIKPDHSGALLHLGTTLVEQGQVQEAIAQFDQAVQADPESAAAHYNLGLALIQLGQLDEAIAHYREAILHDDAFADVHTALGNALIAMQQTDEAIRCFKRELEIVPGAVDARINLAVLLRETDPRAAKQYLLEAVKIAPKNTQAQYNLGAFLLLQGEPREAIAPLSEAVRLAPDHPRAKSELEKARRLIEAK